jgi:hypothetical protein
MYLQKISILLYINPLSKIHNTGLIIAYFGLDNRVCKCLEYLYLDYLCLYNCDFKSHARTEEKNSSPFLQWMS